MSERIIPVESVNPVDIYGVNNIYIELIKKIFPLLKIIARGDIIKVIGKDEDIEVFERRFKILLIQYEKFGRITENDIHQLMEVDDITVPDFDTEQNDIILYGRSGKLIKTRTANQRKMVKGCEKNDLLIAIGPAGTGKTYTAVAIAVRALKSKEIKRIVLTRPAVEAGENLGFLPGDLRDKLDPYLQPLYDALRDMIPPQKLLSYLEDGTIEIAPLAFMRGRTLDNVFAILDEGQNATQGQLKMFLTRMGKSSKFIVTGDITQIDLPKNQISGLVHASKILKNVSGIEFIYLNENDIIRHKLVIKIIDAYSNNNERK